MKNIILLCPGFAADENDSACIPPLQLYVRTLKESQIYRLTVISLQYPERHEESLWYGVPHFSVYQKGVFSKWRSRWAAWKQLSKIHKKQRIDLIHSFWLNGAAWIGYQFSEKYKIPHLVTLMGQDARKSNKFLSLFPLREMYLVALSAFHARIFKASTGVDIPKIIPWGIEKIDPFPERKKIIDILGVGNLTPLKNYALFLKVIAKLKMEFPQLQARIIGIGAENRALQNQIQTLQLEEQVQLLGKLPRAQVLETMQESKVFFHPSEYESYGYVFAEALQNGMSIVSREVGFAEASKRWLLAEDETGFVDAIRQFLFKDASNDSQVLHDIEQVTKDYRKLYDSLMG